MRMKETKFIISGKWNNPNKISFGMYDKLGYIKNTEQEAIETCQLINPDFQIYSIIEEVN